MNSPQDISALVARWRDLTQAEGEAIQAAAWSAVTEIQTAKLNLQSSLSEAMRILDGQAAVNLAAARERATIRAEVKRLISLEARNQDLLAAQRQRAQAEKEALENARRNLRKVRQSYAGKREAAFECYS